MRDRKKVKRCDLRVFHVIEGTIARNQVCSAHPFILIGNPNWLHTYRASVVATWRSGLRAPLVTRNKPNRF